MSGYVWISTAKGHPSNMRPMTHGFSDDPQQLELACAARAKNDAGESVPAESFPSEIYGASHAKESDYNLPNIFFAGLFWVVSKAAADVMRQFDLGGGGLYPAKVLKKDRTTPVDGEWFCINFGNQKQAFLPEQSANSSERYIRDGRKGWFPRAAMKDMDFAFTADAASGPDIWLDHDVGDCILFSAALGDALKKAKADKGFFLKKGRVV
jgi:hypothetical protein